MSKDSRYKINEDGRRWWCNSHQRPATHVRDGTFHCCDPNLGGILLPCDCVDLTDEIEIEDEQSE